MNIDDIAKATLREMPVADVIDRISALTGITRRKVLLDLLAQVMGISDRRFLYVVCADDARAGARLRRFLLLIEAVLREHTGLPSPDDDPIPPIIDLNQNVEREALNEASASRHDDH